ncbi:MAG: hypothetical protein WBG50_26710 [Desulfomonilaceae bacterium]
MEKTSFTVSLLGECTIVFEDEEKIETAELADFLFLFRGVYAAGLQVAGITYNAEAEIEPYLFAKEIHKYLQKIMVSQLDELFQQDLGSNRLLTERITHDSPTELVLYGSIILIITAAVLSGGSIELAGGMLKARLNPIGKGIKLLREAFNSEKRAPVGFGVKSRTVKLSQEELNELMGEVPEERDKGGFQHFLGGLQMRVNQNTRELELSEDDMDRIMRHGKDRKKGGFQRRIYNVFHRHFDLGDKN